MALCNQVASFTYEWLSATVAVVAATIAVYYKYKFTFWKKAGLPNVLPPSIPFGNATKLMTNQLHISQQVQEYYNIFKSKGLKHGGVYLGARPYYVPVDPEIVKNILQKDFEHFTDHGNYIDEHSDPLSGHLFNLEGARWRRTRLILTPTFTSGKMKMMFQTLVDCAVGLKKLMDQAVVDKTPVDVKETFSRFTTDIIVSCAFGLECNSLGNIDCEFRKHGRKIFQLGFVDYVKFISTFIVPHALLRCLRFKLTSAKVEEFFMKAIKEAIDYRKNHSIFRRDLLHLLLQLKNKGKAADDTQDDGKATYDNDNIEKSALTMNQLAAHAFGFFVAGIETSSVTMTFLLYELAIDPELQSKLREEINTVLALHNGKLMYESIVNMTYMDKVINEALRKYPPVFVLPRVCTKDYSVPGTDVLIKKGTDVIIPVLSLQNDPEYFPEPNEFRPERFNEENNLKRHPFTFIPFGEGPRTCIGKRFGLMQSKVGLATLLRDYRIKLNPKTQVPLKIEKRIVIPLAEGGIWIDVERLN